MRETIPPILYNTCSLCDFSIRRDGKETENYG